MSDEELTRRFLKAEGLALKDRPEIKRKWLKAICPKCGAKVVYSPKPNFSGELYCGGCGKRFKLTLLTNFTIEDEAKK